MRRDALGLMDDEELRIGRSFDDRIRELLEDDSYGGGLGLDIEAFGKGVGERVAKHCGKPLLDDLKTGLLAAVGLADAKEIEEAKQKVDATCSFLIGDKASISLLLEEALPPAPSALQLARIPGRRRGAGDEPDRFDFRFTLSDRLHLLQMVSPQEVDRMNAFMLFRRDVGLGGGDGPLNWASGPTIGLGLMANLGNRFTGALQLEVTYDGLDEASSNPGNPSEGRVSLDFGWRL